MTKIGIISVVRNEKNNFLNFYDSLRRQTFQDFTLFLIDNNSSDGSLDYFRQLNENSALKVRFITLDRNAGFAGGSNTGAREAIAQGCKYLFILNNDVVMEKKCLEELVRLLESGENIAAAGLLLFRDKEKFPGVIQEYGGKIDFRKGSLKKFYEGMNFSDVKIPERIETDFIGGGMCLIKAHVFEEAGMFEESYFGYFDEIDLSYRLKVLRHYNMLVTSKAVAYHNHDWTKKNKHGYYTEYYLGERNKFLYFRKYKLYFGMIYTVFVDLIKFPWRLIWFVKVCGFKAGLYYIKGMLSGLLNRSGKPEFLFN